MDSSQKFCQKCGGTSKVTTKKEGSDNVRVYQGGGRAVNVQRQSDGDPLITIERPTTWVASLGPIGQATFEGINFTHKGRVENREALKKELQANGTRVQLTVANAHSTSLLASNPGIMMEGLFLPGEELVIPIFDSLSYNTVKIVAFPEGKMQQVDEFKEGVFLITNKRIILVSTQQHQSHLLMQDAAAPRDKYHVSSSIAGQTEVYPIANSAVQAVHLRMNDVSSVVSNVHAPSVGTDDPNTGLAGFLFSCAWLWGWLCCPREPRRWGSAPAGTSHSNVRLLVSYSFCTSAFCLNDYIPDHAARRCTCIGALSGILILASTIYNPPRFSGAQCASRVRQNIDVNMPPFGDCRIMVAFVDKPALGVSGTINLAKKYLLHLGNCAPHVNVVSYQPQ
jgi:hypothetical protein